MKHTHPLYFLARETAAYIKRYIPEFHSSGQKAAAIKFIDEIEKVSQQTMQGQWPGGAMVRALRFAPHIFGKQCVAGVKPLYEAACASFAWVRWAEFYEEDDWSRSFLPNFANGEGIGPDGRFFNSKIILGLFLLGPNTHYPAHAHPAEEFYLILSGTAKWQIGANTSFETKKPGDVMIHLSNESHSFQTHNEPLFCIYGWRGDINAKTWYRNNMADNTEKIKNPTIRK